MRIGSLGQIFLMVCSAGLELIGIGLIVPIITVITGSSSQSKNSILQPVFDRFGFVDEKSMVVLALGLLGLAFLLKSLFAAYMGWSQIHFSLKLEQDLSRRLFRSFIGKPYLFHVQRNSADLMHTVGTEVGQVQGTCSNILSLLSELTIVVALGSLVLYSNLLASISSISILVGASFL